MQYVAAILSLGLILGQPARTVSVVVALHANFCHGLWTVKADVAPGKGASTLLPHLPAQTCPNENIHNKKEHSYVAGTVCIALSLHDDQKRAKKPLQICRLCISVEAAPGGPPGGG